MAGVSFALSPVAECRTAGRRPHRHKGHRQWGVRCAATPEQPGRDGPAGTAFRGHAPSADPASSSSTRLAGGPHSAVAGPRPAGPCTVRLATATDYWPIAHVHLLSFYGNVNEFWSSLLRCDRVVALQVGSEKQDQQLGQFACLVAVTEPAGGASSSSPSSSAGGAGADEGREEGPLPMDWLVGAAARALLPPGMQQRFSGSHVAGNVWGATTLDTLADFIPLKKHTAYGVTRFARRRGIAHLANLAVVPSARRLGIGRQLLESAEALAAEWGCRSIALHVDPTNTPAVQMYESHGYRRAVQQPTWQQLLEGRPHPLVLMMRRLPRRQGSAGDDQHGATGAA